jgi:hypothetical protein
MRVLVDEVGGGLIPGGQPGVRQDLWLENTGIKDSKVILSTVQEYYCLQ